MKVKPIRNDSARCSSLPLTTRGSFWLGTSTRSMRVKYRLEYNYIEEELSSSTSLLVGKESLFGQIKTYGRRYSISQVLCHGCCNSKSDKIRGTGDRAMSCFLDKKAHRLLQSLHSQTGQILLAQNNSGGLFISLVHSALTFANIKSNDRES